MQRKLSKSEAELQLLKAITLSIVNAKNFNEALDICFRMVCEATGWAYGEVWMASNDNNGLYIADVFYGEHEKLKEFYDQSKQITFTLNTGIPGLVWQTRQPLWIRDISSDSSFIRASLAHRFNLKSALGIPVMIDDNMVSVIVFFMLESEKDEGLINLLLAIVSQLSFFLKRLYLDDTLRKVNRALKVLSDCNQAIIRATEELTLLNDICKIMVDSGGYRMALFAFAQHDEHKSIKIITYAGFSGDYIEQLNDLTWADAQPKAALSGKVIRTGKPSIVRDISTDPYFSPWKDTALKQGYKSILSLPLIIDNDVIGVFNVYASEQDAFDTEEHKLLEELANDISYGIMSLRTKLEKEKVKERQEQLTDIIESTTDLVVIADAQLHGIYINQGGLKLLGIKHEPSTGIDIRLFLSEEAIHTLDLAILHAAQHGTWSGESTLKREDSRLVPVSQVVIAHKSSGGKLEFISTIARDLTENKKLQSQLYQAQKMEAIGQLAAGVAHDFNNMLTAVIGYGNILSNKLKDNEQLRYDVEQILNASEKAAGLVQSLLTFGRKHETSLMPLDLNGTIITLLSLLKTLLGEHVVLKTGLTSGQLTIIANKSQIEQILMNLAGNANDAMPDGGSLKINTMVMAIDEQFIWEHGYGKPGKFALLTVTDTGSGISKDVIERIFEPFFTTKPVGKGTGLGLSIVYGIIKQHRGYVDVTSELGKGTTFNIYLPLTGNMPDNK